MRISKKILAIALSILMAVSMMPFTVFAATVGVEDGAQLKAAIASASAGDTIQLGEDITVTEPIVIPAGANVQIDLNGHSISGNIADTDGKKLFQVSGTLEFVGTLGGCIYNTNTAGQGHAACQALTGGTVIVSAPITFGDSDEIRDNANNTNRGCGIQNNGGTLIINNGYYTAIDANYSTGAWAYAILNVAGDTTINNATVYGNALHGALGCEGGTLTVNGGTFAVNGATNYYCLYADDDGVITVNDGTFTNNGKYALVSTGENSTVNIEGGDFTYSVPFKTSGNADKGTVEVSGGTFSGTDPVPAKYIADGAEYDATTGTVTQEYVAKVGENYYATFEAALAAISTVTTATHSKAVDPTYEYKTYKANGTIKLLADTTSNGVIIDSGSNLTIDFNGKTLDINAKPVGSNGTESAAMQLLKDSNITFKDGTLTSSYTYASTDKEYIQRLIQNYADLTLNNMNVGMRGNFMDQMMMSNCNGDVTITNSTISAPDFTWAGYTDAQAAESLGTRVMGVGSFSTAYPDVNVSVTNSTINGDVNIDITAAGTTAELTLNGSDVNGNIVDENMNGATVTNAGSTVDGIPAGYEWNATTGVLGPIADGFNLTVEDCIHMNLYVNAAAYGADEIVVTYSDPDKQNGGTKTETFDVADLEQDAQGRYEVKILAAPAQMGDDVTVTAGSHTYTTSVKEYCNALIAANQSEALTKLAKAMLEYGAEAANEFSYSTSLTRGNYIQLYNDTHSGVFSQTNRNGLCGIKSIAYIATSVPSLRLYFDDTVTETTMATEGAKTATVDGQTVDVTVDPEGHVCVDIKGIKAEDLDKTYTVEVGDNTIQVNALLYAEHTLNTSFGNAIFQYNRAAEAVFGTGA